MRRDAVNINILNCEIWKVLEEIELGVILVAITKSQHGSSIMQFTPPSLDTTCPGFVFLQGWLCLWLFTTTKPGPRMTSASGRGRGSRSSTARKCENIWMTAFRVAIVFSFPAFCLSKTSECWIWKFRDTECLSFIALIWLLKSNRFAVI